jgi:hypothetical protein
LTPKNLYELAIYFAFNEVKFLMIMWVDTNIII